MAVDTSTFARLLLSGAQQGIGLGQSIDQQRFQQQQFDANQQQQAFGNMMALQGLDMRRQQLAWEAEDRTKQWQAENERDAANQAVLKAMTTADDATFQSAIPSLLPVLNKASPDLQRGLLNKQAYLQQYQKEAAMLESLRSQGGKLTAEQADKYRERGHTITRDMLAKTAREEQDAKDQQNIDAMIVSAVSQGLVGEQDIPQLKRYATPQLLHADLTARSAIKQQQEKQLADQQAAIQKQQQQQAAYSNARSAAVKAGANPTEVDARIAADQAGLSLGDSPFKQPMEDPKVFARKQIQDIDGELQFIDEQLMQAGVASRAKVSDPVMVDPKKAANGEADPGGWFSSPKPATPEYQRVQQLLKRRDQLIQARQETGAQVVGQPTQQQQVDGKALIQQFTAQNGRKPSVQELADLLRQRSQGMSPQQSTPR